MRRVLLLLLLAGCSDPYAPVESGAFWLVEVGPSALPSGGPPGSAFWLSRPEADLLLKQVREGREGPLRETARFDVSAGREVALAVEGGFDLRFTVKPSGQDRVLLSYRFAWSGQEAVDGGMGASSRSVAAFLRTKPGNRRDLLLVAVNELKP